MFFLALACAWGFERAQMIISAPNYGTPFNGYGAIDLTFKREIKAPMSYRILVPVLVTWAERLTHLPRIGLYQYAKMVLNTLAFWAVGLAFGIDVMLMTVLLLLLTIKFDYWSWAAELAGIALAMTGNVPLALTGGIVAGLSKETALLVPVTYYVKTFDLAGAAVIALGTVLTMWAVRQWTGIKPMYCERWQYKYNLEKFKHFLQREFWRQGQWYHQDIFISVVLTILLLAAGLVRYQELTSLPPLALLVAGWTMAKGSDEARVFAGALPWVAMLILGVAR